MEKALLYVHVIPDTETREMRCLGFGEGTNAWVHWIPRLKSWEYKMKVTGGG